MILTKPYIIEGIKLKEKASILIQEKIHKYDYVSINLNEILTKEQLEELYHFQGSLPSEYIYVEPDDYGIERDIHTTIFYGLKSNEDNFSIIDDYIKTNINSIELTIKGISFFRHSDSPYDVMKFEVESEGMRKIHSYVSSLPNENTFLDFSPHITIAYIKKGTFTDNQWQGYNSFTFCNKPIAIPEIEFQDIYGNKKIIYI